MIAAAVCLAFLIFLSGFLGSAPGGTAVIRIADGTETVFSLSEDRAFDVTSGGITLRVEISGGSIRVAGSDCPGHDCVRSGAISRSGEVIVCAPAGVVISVRGKGGGPDGIAG